MRPQDVPLLRQIARHRIELRRDAWPTARCHVCGRTVEATPNGEPYRHRSAYGQHCPSSDAPLQPVLPPGVSE